MVEWTHDQAINYECACTCICNLIAIKQAEIYAEESNAFPSNERIASLRKDIGALWREKEHLSVQDTAEIARIRLTYGAEVRMHPSGAPASQ